jgi:hypothetical protein
LLLSTALLIGSTALPAAEPLKTETFDRDPGWDAFNNRLKPDPKEIRSGVQDFGYSATNFAGGAKGELGGEIWRSATPAYYAEKIPIKTLDDKLTASGKFSFDPLGGGSGIWFGWFKAEQGVASARPKEALGLDFDFERGGGRLAVRMSNQQNRFCGTFVTPYIPGKFRPAPLQPHVSYNWSLAYDPQGNAGLGRIEVTIKSSSTDPAKQARDAQLRADAAQLPAGLQAQFGSKVGAPDFEGRVFTVDLPAGFKQEGAAFDHFGLHNLVKEGTPAKVWFDDLQHDGKSEDFTRDPQWEGAGNRARFQETLPIGYHDFGFSAATHFAGGAPGEIGGSFWRLSKAYGYYADRVGTLTLEDALEARGKLVLQVGTPDSEMAFGWFSSAQKDIPVHMKNGKRQEGHLDKSDNFLGVYLAGPSRLGRCLQPALVTEKGSRVIFNKVDEAPRPTPGTVYDWTVKYDPSGAGGLGTVTVTLGDTSATLTLDANAKAEGARFDRFGFFPSGGGGLVQIYFDNLHYTARRP